MNSTEIAWLWPPRYTLDPEADFLGSVYGFEREFGRTIKRTVDLVTLANSGKVLR